MCGGRARPPAAGAGQPAASTSMTESSSRVLTATDAAPAGRRERAAVDSRIAGEVSALLARGDHEEAGERFAQIVERHQRRAARIAYYYLRDPAEVDEAVQDAFLKAFVNIRSFRERLYFELWFTRILVNGCLDRLKSRARRSRWIAPAAAGDGESGDAIERRPAPGPSPEATLLRAERRAELLAAVDRLPERQRAVVVLSRFEGHATRDVAAMLELSEATVRVHLFRAIRSLRRILGAGHWFAEQPARPADEARRA